MKSWLTIIWQGSGVGKMASRAAAAAVLAGVSLAASTGQAQITARHLLAPAVSELGPQYQEVEDAIVRFRNRDFDGAKALLEASCKKHPQLAPADVMFAQLMLEANQLLLARNALEEAVRDTPADPEAYIAFGEIALRERRFTEAGLAFNQGLTAVEKYDANPRRKRHLQLRVYAGLIGVASAREAWAEVEKLAAAWLKIDPENTAAMTRLAQAQFHLGRDQEAYKTFGEAFKNDSQITRPEIAMAQLFEQTGKRPNAKKLIDLAIERDPNGLATRITAAQWAIEAGDWELARKNIEAIRKIDAKSLEGLLLTGLLARYEKKYAEAEEAFAAAHLQSPSNPLATNQLALVLIEQSDENKRRRALEYAEMVVRQYNDVAQPDGREAAVTYAWVLYQLGKTNEALQLLERALQSGGISADSAYRAARMAHDQGQREPARRLLQSAVEGKQNFPSRAEAKKLFDKIAPAGN